MHNHAPLQQDGWTCAYHAILHLDAAVHQTVQRFTTEDAVRSRNWILHTLLNAAVEVKGELSITKAETFTEQVAQSLQADSQPFIPLPLGLQAECQLRPTSDAKAASQPLE
eukprot:2039921-Rhodomonas_salina.2